MTPALALAAGGLVGWGVWMAAKKARPPKARPRAAEGTRTLELWLLGDPIPSGLVLPLQVAAALAAAAVGQAATGNPVVALLLATLGWYAPPSAIQSAAARVWGRADDQAHTLANVLQFALPVHGNPYVALRHVLGNVGEPLRGWLERVVAGEAAGTPVEDGLAALGRRLRHRELELLAAILRADRRAAPSHALLTELLPDWTERVRAASERRATLAVAQYTSNLFVWGPLVVFLVLEAFTPLGAAFKSSLIGQALAAGGVAVLVTAAHVTRSTLAKERRLTGE